MVPIIYYKKEVGADGGVGGLEIDTKICAAKKNIVYVKFVHLHAAVNSRKISPLRYHRVVILASLR